MRNLKRNKPYYLMLFPLIMGCATSSYRVVPWGTLKNAVIVTPERILLECEYITDYSGDLKNPYGFMIHMLDEKNTVVTASQGNVLDKEDCFEGINEIRKILKNGKVITLGGMGDLIEPRQSEKTAYFFPGLGRFQSNGRHLQFMMIWNEHDECYDSQFGKGKPCPRDDFSNKKAKSP
jgi:hypothetical protein